MKLPYRARFLVVGVVHCIVIAGGCIESKAQPQPAPTSPAQTATPQGGKRAAEATETGLSWPCWRGSTHQGIALGYRLPTKWPSGRLVPVWEAKTESGWSSPVVADGRVFVTDRLGAEERVIALDAQSGRQLWARTNPVDFDPHAVGRRHGNGPKGTPIVDGGRVYTVGIAGWLQCLDARDGRVIWHTNFPAEFGARVPLPGGRAFVDGTESVVVPVGNGQGAPVPLFGYTGSPMLDGNLLVTSVGGQRAGTIMAFDKLTGKVVWKALQENVSYSSPVVATLAGVRQVVVMTGPRIVGLELATGQLLWSHPFQVQYDESIATPAVGEEMVVVTGDGHPLEALRISREGAGLAAKLAWENYEMSSYLSSMVIHAGYAYGMNGGGEFGCVRLSDGKTLWTGGHHGSYCTPVLAGNSLLGLTERGELTVVEAQPQAYREVGQSTLSDTATWTSPALVGNRLYVRSARSVLAFELAP